MGKIAYSLRAVEESDWPAILRAADAALPNQRAMNREWLTRRQSFPVDQFARSHYVAAEAQSASVVGYGAIEGGEPAGSFRLFIVMSPHLLDAGAGDLIFDALRRDLGTFHARTAWTRELASDMPLRAFFRRHGLSEKERYCAPGGIDILVMQLPLDSAGATQ